MATFARSPLFIVLLLGCVVGLWLLDRARRGERGVTPQDWGLALAGILGIATALLVAAVANRAGTRFLFGLFLFYAGVLVMAQPRGGFGRGLGPRYAGLTRRDWGCLLTLPAAGLLALLTWLLVRGAR